MTRADASHKSCGVSREKEACWRGKGRGPRRRERKPRDSPRKDADTRTIERRLRAGNRCEDNEQKRDRYADQGRADPSERNLSGVLRDSSCDAPEDDRAGDAGSAMEGSEFLK